MNTLFTLRLSALAALTALALTAQAAGAESGGDMQVPLAGATVGLVGVCGAAAAAVGALWRRVK